jgi:hypothetical protein
VIQRRTLPTWVFVAALASVPAETSALEARVIALRTSGTRLWTSIELRELLRDKFLALIRDGRAVFLELQADLWEDRRIFDRVVFTIPPTTYRVDPAVIGPGIVVTDQQGTSTGQPDAAAPLVLRVDMGPADRVDDERSYYVHALVTAASVEERDIEQAGQAIFGNDEAARGLAAIGLFVFRSLLRVGRYIERSSAETTSRQVTGREIRTSSF